MNILAWRKPRVCLSPVPWRALAAFAVLGVAAPSAAAPQESPATVAAAPQGDPYAIDRYTIDGGGGRSSGGNYTIEGTIGQPDADPLQPSTGGIYSLSGGFWPGLVDTTPRPDPIFGDGFE